MSGVQSGTRLERLTQLQARARMRRAQARWAGDLDTYTRLDTLVKTIQTHIEAEHAAAARAARARPTVAAGVRRTDQTVEERLRAMGVTTHQVKTWAVEQGLLTAVLRGRVSGLLVDAYATAHQEPAP